MLTRYTKERLSRKKLIDVSQNKIPEEPIIMQDLKYLKDEDLELDYNYSGSDITDPFDEEENEMANNNDTNTSNELKKARKKFSQLETNYKLMNSFSEEFKKCMDEVRAEFNISKEIGYQDIAEVDRTLKSALSAPKVPQELKNEIERILWDDKYLKIGPEFEIMAPPEETVDAPPVNKYDAMSSVWRMLDSNKKLLITPQGYDAQRQKHPHWMDAPDTPWEDVDDSKAKCEEWIKSQG